MTRWIGIIAILVFTICTIPGCGDKAAKDTPGEINPPLWPCPTGSFMGDNVTSHGIPENPTTSWSVELPGAECTPPIIDNTGGIIVGTSEGMKCFSPEGEQVWSTDAASHIKTAPVLDNDSRIIVPYGDSLTVIDPDGNKTISANISRYVAHHATVDSAGNIYIDCMEPISLTEIAANPPENLPAKSAFRGHINIFNSDLKQTGHIETGIINCPLRPKDEDAADVFFAPKLFDRWRPDTQADPVFWKTTLLSTRDDFQPIPLPEIEHGVVDMFFDKEGILHMFGHIEHLPLPEERNMPTNESGYVYKVQSFFYDPDTGEFHKEHWPWMTPEEKAAGTYKEFRQHFNRVRFVHMTESMDAFKPAYGTLEDEEHEGCHHGPGEHVLDEVKDFVKGCRHLIISETGRMLGGTDSIKCFDVASNKVIWEIAGDPSSIALAGNGRMYCLVRLPDEDKCILTCYAN